jgi:hypothetical protein
MSRIKRRLELQAGAIMIYNLTSRIRSAAWLPGAMLLTLGVAHADPIGQATEAKNDVRGELASVVRPLAPGSEVSANETVRTGDASATLLEFLDNSKLNVGASSTVVLDKFVFNPESGTDEVIINMTKGAMRFISSGSGKKNVIINTPTATLGIRG